MKTKNLLLIFIFSIALISCKKKETPAPVNAPVTPAAPPCNICGTYKIFKELYINHTTGVTITDTMPYLDTITQFYYAPASVWYHKIRLDYGEGGSVIYSNHVISFPGNPAQVIVGFNGNSVAIGDTMLLTFPPYTNNGQTTSEKTFRVRLQ